MTQWKIVGDDKVYTPICRLYTVWGYWPNEDAIELYAAVDEWTNDDNPDYLNSRIEEAHKKFGSENVREVTVKIPWQAVLDAFAPVRVDGAVGK